MSKYICWCFILAIMLSSAVYFHKYDSRLSAAYDKIAALEAKSAELERIVLINEVMLHPLFIAVCELTGDVEAIEVFTAYSDTRRPEWEKVRGFLNE